MEQKKHVLHSSTVCTKNKVRYSLSHLQGQHTQKTWKKFCKSGETPTQGVDGGQRSTSPPSRPVLATSATPPSYIADVFRRKNCRSSLDYVWSLPLRFTFTVQGKRTDTWMLPRGYLGNVGRDFFLRREEETLLNVFKDGRSGRGGATPTSNKVTHYFEKNILWKKSLCCWHCPFFTVL